MIFIITLTSKKKFNNKKNVCTHAHTEMHTETHPLSLFGRGKLWLGLGVQQPPASPQSSGLGVSGLVWGFKVSGLGFRVSGLGFRV